MSKNPSPSSHPWDSAALFNKARLYFDEMSVHDHDDWRFPLWSSLALELLARAALASVSPTMLADKGQWQNLYFALGHMPTAPKFVPKSIAVSEVLDRLHAIDPAFDKELEDFASNHIRSRNGELHSADVPFMLSRPSAWLGTFYRCCEVLAVRCGFSLDDLIGPEQIDAARRHIVAAKDHAARPVLGVIQTRRTAWEGMLEPEKLKLRTRSSFWASRYGGHVVTCPACQCDALVVGDPIAPAKIVVDGSLVTEAQRKLPSRFECVACGMKIEGLSQLLAAGLGDTFTGKTTYSAAEFFGEELDDEAAMGRYEDDNNEPF